MFWHSNIESISLDNLFSASICPFAMGSKSLGSQTLFSLSQIFCKYSLANSGTQKGPQKRPKRAPKEHQKGSQNLSKSQKSI